jgi:geranylgeranyl reductase family protein
MDSCDILIVGGGPAGSSCAWTLRDSGLDVAILDQHAFPRDKVCGGWITPGVLAKLDVNPAEYGRGRVLQPITGFRTGIIAANGSRSAPSSPGAHLDTAYGSAVSYGIRRREFDDYLLRRSGARLLLGTALANLEYRHREWIVNGQIRARMLVGSGGHFCPVARFLGAKTSRETAVVAREAEFEMDSAQLAGCRVRADRPELYFCSDMRGYGWCFRKRNVLNVGLGRADPHALSSHSADFLRFLKASGRLAFDAPAFHGHAYLLYGTSSRNLAAEGVLLAGDSAGLAYAQSGEGILPAVESGILAANVILHANGNYGREQLRTYPEKLTERLGNPEKDWIARIGRRVPSRWIGVLARRLFSTPWFVRDVVLDRWFLRQPG